MRVKRFMYFCLKNCIGTQGEDVPVVLDQFLLCVSLLFLIWGFRVETCLALYSRVVLLSNFIISIGEDRAGLCAFHAFVCLLCTR